MMDDDHAAIWAAENYVSPDERRWLTWIDRAEALLGHDVDGDQAEDGYSLDGFHLLFKRGLSPAQAVEQIGTVQF